MKYEVLDKKHMKLLQDIRVYFDESSNNIWDKRNKIKIISCQEEELTIKSFKIPHFINKIAYTFLRDSKAQRSYYNSLKILEFVPRPTGYAEFFKLGFMYDSYYVCEKYDYDFTIREPLTQKDFADKETVFEQFANFTYSLHQKGVEHLDYSPGNILIKKLNDRQYEFKIIDVNRMKFKVFTQKECLENFSKLWSNDEDLKLIIDAYAKNIAMNKDEAFEIVSKASQKHKDSKIFKKKFLKYLKPVEIINKNMDELKQAISNISVVMIAKNAEDTIAKSLDSLVLFDEVVVYLNNSTDKTRVIAQAYKNVKIAEGEFLGFGNTRNAAAEYSTNDWILALDSDEVLNENLLNELSHADFTIVRNIYRLKRDNYFLGKKMQNSNMIVRLYNQKFTKFDNSAVHEKVIVPKDAYRITLKHSLTHNYIFDINQTLRKIIHYTDLGAEGKKTCFFSVVIAKSMFAFFKTYVLQGNFIKGWVGFAFSINVSSERYYKYLKMFIHCKKDKNIHV